MKIYYAHHLWKYDTEIELYEIELIRKAFPGATIINPNSDVEQSRDVAAIMSDCIKAAKQCDAVVFSSVNGVIGKGVFDEVTSANATYYINNHAIKPFTGTFQIISNSATNRIYAIVCE